jgi:hypothetical protein
VNGNAKYILVGLKEDLLTDENQLARLGIEGIQLNDRCYHDRE